MYCIDAAADFSETSRSTFSVRDHFAPELPQAKSGPRLARDRRQAMVVRIGTSGWRYKPWRGYFYPRGLPQKKELEFASRCFGTIELNGTFYSLQRPHLFERWHHETPSDFVFAVKGSRFITHMKKLRGIEVPLANFFASGVLRLEEKLGPFLWQFPSGWRFDPTILKNFLELLPRDTHAAAELAANHDQRLVGRSNFQVSAKRTIRHAIEVRDPSFFVPELIALLRAYDVAFVVSETAGKFPIAEDLTASFSYVRLHGAERLYASGYKDEQLRRWARRIRSWSSGREPNDAIRIATVERKLKARPRDVYVYFDNTDGELRAPFDAMKVDALLGRRSLLKSA